MKPAGKAVAKAAAPPAGGSGSNSKAVSNRVNAGLVRFLTNLALMALWKSLLVVAVPLARVLAVYIWLGKSACRLTVYVRRLLLRAIGWSCGPVPARSRIARIARYQLGVDLRRWHLGLGEDTFGAGHQFVKRGGCVRGATGMTCAYTRRGGRGEDRCRAGRELEVAAWCRCRRRLRVPASPEAASAPTPAAVVRVCVSAPPAPSRPRLG